MDSVLQTLAGLEPWALYLLIAALVFGESAAVVAVLMPGEIALLAAGAAAAHGYASLPVVIAVAIIAAVAGHAAGYEVGRRHGLRILRWPLLRRHAGAVEATAAMVVRRGGAAVLLGRWTNVGRVVVPVLVGAMRMRYRTFTLFNVLGGVAWAVTFVLLGAMAGSSVGATASTVRNVSAWLTAVVVILVALGLARRASSRRHRAVAHNGRCGSDDLRWSNTLASSSLPRRSA